MNSLPLSEWIPARWNGNRSCEFLQGGGDRRSPLDRTCGRGPAGGDVGGVKVK